MLCRVRDPIKVNEIDIGFLVLEVHWVAVERQNFFNSEAKVNWFNCLWRDVDLVKLSFAHVVHIRIIFKKHSCSRVKANQSSNINDRDLAIQPKLAADFTLSAEIVGKQHIFALIE